MQVKKVILLNEADVPAAEGSDELYAVIVDTYESKEYPVVRHIFYGQTEEEAMKYLEAHKETDKFFTACFTGKFGDIQCRNVTSGPERVDPEEV